MLEGGAISLQSRRRAPRPTVECWTLTAPDVEAWLKKARPGERLVYAHGPVLVHGAAAAMLGRLSRSGDVLLCQRRNECGGFDYLAVRNRVKLVERIGLPKIDTSMLAVLTVLQSAAASGQRCPSDAGLAALTGLRPDQAKWQMRKLQRDGIIHSRFVPTAAEPKFRVVKIAASGDETAMPGCGR